MKKLKIGDHVEIVNDGNVAWVMKDHLMPQDLIIEDFGDYVAIDVNLGRIGTKWFVCGMSDGQYELSKSRYSTEDSEAWFDRGQLNKIEK